MQLVGYEPSGRGASLLASDGDRGEVRRLSLDAGEELDFGLGERRCAGSIDDEGVHHACGRPVAPYCEYHTTSWVCARCTGTCLKPEMDCYDPHAVYLAAFAPDTVKVGVTRAERLETRLREQGADRGAHIHTVSNGRIARELEAEIATRFTDRVRIPTKRAGLAEDVDDGEWETAIAEFDVLERFEFDYGLDLAARPVAETIAAGTVRGVKGRLLVLDRGATTYAVDLRDLVGYELEPGAAGERRLQSSLESF